MTDDGAPAADIAECTDEPDCDRSSGTTPVTAGDAVPACSSLNDEDTRSADTARTVRGAAAASELDATVDAAAAAALDDPSKDDENGESSTPVPSSICGAPSRAAGGSSGTVGRGMPPEGLLIISEGEAEYGDLRKPKSGRLDLLPLKGIATGCEDSGCFLMEAAAAAAAAAADDDDDDDAAPTRLSPEVLMMLVA